MSLEAIVSPSNDGTMPISSQTDFYEDIGKFASELEQEGYLDQSKKLIDTIDTFWTTTSELFGELRNLLISIGEMLKADRKFELSNKAAHYIRQIDDAFRKANRLL